MLQIQTSEPLMLMIDSAPLFLGLFAFIAGKHLDKLTEVNKDRVLLLQNLENKNEELEVKVALRTELLEINTQKALAASNAKSQFVAAISHELRTPLTAINGALKLISGGVAGEQNQKTLELLALAQKNSDRLMELINKLLDLSALENGSITVICTVQPLYPVLQQVVSENQLYADACDINLQLHPLNFPCELNVDKARLIQILNNIISNAIKFSPPKSLVEILAFERQNRVCIAVKDQGCGIASTMKHKIFESFSASNQGNTRQTRSLGLGLKLSKELVSQMQGSIDFESELGKGSTFNIWLPRVAR